MCLSGVILMSDLKAHTGRKSECLSDCRCCPFVDDVDDESGMMNVKSISLSSIKLSTTQLGVVNAVCILL